MSRLTRGSAALSIAALVAIGLQTPALAQDGQGSERCAAVSSNGEATAYPPAQQEGVSDANPERGQLVSASSGCREFAPGQQVAFGVESVYQELGTVVATVDGEVGASFRVPTNLADGLHHVVFRGTGFTGAANEVRIPFTVAGGPATGVAADAPAPAGTVNVGGVALPRTGSDEVVPMTALGVSLVLGGAFLVIVARRSRRHEALAPLA